MKSLNSDGVNRPDVIISSSDLGASEFYDDLPAEDHSSQWSAYESTIPDSVSISIDNDQERSLKNNIRFGWGVIITANIIHRYVMTLLRWNE